METPLPLVYKNVCLDLEGALAGIRLDRADVHTAGGICGMIRILASCHILMKGDLSAYVSCLSMGASSFAAWLEVTTDQRKRTSIYAPFLDAVNAGDTVTADKIFRLSRSTLNQGREFEEDFAYARLLQVFACVERPEDEAGRLLKYWKGVSGGGEIRFNLCQALLDQDAEVGKKSLAALLAEWNKAVRKRQQNESGNPDERCTVDRLCMEAAGVISIAKRNRGIDIRVRHAHVPNDLLRASVKCLPAPDAWRDVNNYRDLMW